MYILDVLGHNIKFYREQAGLTQEELAFRAEISSSYLSRLEGGKQNLTSDIADRIAMALGIYTYQLYMESRDREPAEVLSKARINRMTDRRAQMSPEQQKKTLQMMDYITSLRWEEVDQDEIETK